MAWGGVLDPLTTVPVVFEDVSGVGERRSTVDGSVGEPESRDRSPDLRLGPSARTRRRGPQDTRVCFLGHVLTDGRSLPVSVGGAPDSSSRSPQLGCPYPVGTQPRGRGGGCRHTGTPVAIGTIRGLRSNPFTLHNLVLGSPNAPRHVPDRTSTLVTEANHSGTRDVRDVLRKTYESRNTLL